MDAERVNNRLDNLEKGMRTYRRSLSDLKKSISDLKKELAQNKKAGNSKTSIKSKS